MINFTSINTVEGGNSKELANNVEKKNTYTKGLNGRIYSKDNTFSFTSIKGSKLVYKNDDIVKWLGYYSFRNEAIVFAKCLKPVGGGQVSEEEICKKVINSDSFTISDSVTTLNKIFITDEISVNSAEVESCYTITKPIEDPTDFQVNYSEVTENNLQVDFGEFYKERFNVTNYKICPINLGQVPINNETYYDTIISFTINDAGELEGRRIWTGAQNWPMKGKVTCEGVEENEFYKRVYYTDAVNPRRVINIKDSSLVSREASEFNQVLDNVLLQPQIVGVEDGGQLPSMQAMYLYRIISENGQVSEFSPFSEMISVLPEEEAIEFRGGEVSEPTGKKVKIKCSVPEPELSSEIECIVLEFEAAGVPTSIRNLGIKPLKEIVEFEHLGTESEFGDNITIQDVLEFKNTWSFCNDFTSKKNKLIAAGLRNNPVPTEISNLEYLFLLHGWKSNGDTHHSLMNPQPWEYRYIDPTNTDPMIYVRQKKYTEIASFGPCTLNLVNKLTGNKVFLQLPELSLQEYTDVTDEVIQWLLEEYSNEYFQSVFPNLKIVDNNGQLLFTYEDINVQSDFENYVFESNNEQFIENFENDLFFLDPVVNTSKLVYGAESIGFSKGTGVRITYREFKEPLLNQATKIYDGTDKLLDYYAPTMEKYCMKGEIYRLGFQAYDKKSSRYFAIPIGDVMIPELGDVVKEIDDQGNVVVSSKTYLNQSVENGVLYGHGVKMHVEVRLSCELQEMISMYQLLYVERTEDNRTILCQGISAPLFRHQYKGDDDQKMPDDVLGKWVLPYYGGPVYDKRGLRSYDEEGENWKYEGNGNAGGEEYKKIMTSRRLMYFDSPDLYYRKISGQYFKNAKLNVVAKLNTDHTPRTIMEHGNYSTFPKEVYPKFSRKIHEAHLEGTDLNLEDLPREAREEREDGTHETYFINVSVFAKYQNIPKQSYDIDFHEEMRRGEVISGTAFELDHDVSNNAMAAPCMPWFFSQYQMRSDTQNGDPRATLYKWLTVSPGYPTVILKATQDVFTDSFIGPDVHEVDTQIRLGGGPHTVYDTYPLINVYRNNRDSVYGGRSKQAYSKNTFIPLSKTIPVSNNEGVQYFDVGADTYVTLNIRTKNDAGDTPIEERVIRNGGGGKAKGKITTWQRNGAWNYVTVLETQVEPKLDYGYNFYRKGGTFRFDLDRPELINGAYLNENNIKQFIPKPFKFKDDPNMGSVIAVSDVKLSGEVYDSWTMFKPNNFYAELERNRGDISNIIRHNDEVFAVQEDQTSMVYIGVDRVISDSQGNPINIKQGSGQVVEGHKVISNYGTAIRRAVVESEHGFSFFDEKHIEFVKMGKPLLVSKLLHHDYWDQFKNNPIIDTEAFYDHEFKETNIRLRSKNGENFVISYNELVQVFNGEFEYDNDLYLPFDKKLYAPLKDSPNSLHQLNVGDYLNLFGSQKELKIGSIINAQLDKVFLFRMVAMVTSLTYPVKSVYFKSSLGQERTVYGTHPWYKIREGNHSVPAKNETNIIEELADIRGNWVYVEITLESLNKNKVDILAIINSLRFSHQ